MRFLVGAATGVAEEILFQLATSAQGDWECLDWEQIGLAGLFGGLSAVGLGGLGSKIGNWFKKWLKGWRRTADTGEVMVLGKVGYYERLADQLGAKKFAIPKDIWARMSPAERKAANIRSINRSIKRGDSFIFSNNPSEAFSGSGFDMEIKYLKSLGINIDDIPVIEPW